MKKITLTLGLIIGMISLLQAQAPKVFLPYLEAINIKKDFQISSSKLLKNYIDLANAYQVVMDSNKDTLFDSERSIEDIKNKAVQLNAKYFIKGSLNRIGENVIVNVSLFETETGIKIWFDQMKATSPEDLDPIMQRMANALGTKEKATTKEDIYSVTNNESEALKQKQTNNSLGGGVGGTILFNHENIQLTTLTAGWYFDARNYIMDIRPSLSFNPGRMYIFNVALEMFKPHTNEANSFFYGGGLAFSNTSYIYGQDTSKYSSPSNDYSGAGIMLNAGGGYLFNRTSAASVRLSGNLIYGLYDLRGTRSNLTPPFGFEIKAEILFRR